MSQITQEQLDQCAKNAATKAVEEVLETHDSADQLVTKAATAAAECVLETLGVQVDPIQAAAICALHNTAGCPAVQQVITEVAERAADKIVHDKLGGRR